MGRKAGAPSATELEALKLLWQHGPSTIRQITDRLYPEGGPAQYATVQKLLERLENKSCVRRSRRQRVNVYTATLDREALIGRRLRETARDLCAGSLTPLLTHLAAVSELSPEELRRLRELVDDRSAGRRR